MEIDISMPDTFHYPPINPQKLIVVIIDVSIQNTIKSRVAQCDDRKNRIIELFVV